MDYKVIDGGVYDNPDIGIREALNEIIEDLGANFNDRNLSHSVGN
ncbi:MAG: hypothetical protein NC121_11375 [Blautia sp.]|nr:hypothetical protein [Blautia sp.]